MSYTAGRLAAAHHLLHGLVHDGCDEARPALVQLVLVGADEADWSAEVVLGLLASVSDLARLAERILEAHDDLVAARRLAAAASRAEGLLSRERITCRTCGDTGVRRWETREGVVVDEPCELCT